MQLIPVTNQPRQRMAGNPLRAAGYDPQMTEGIITRKVIPNDAFIQECMQNDGDPRMLGACYPKGSMDRAHDIKQGMMVFTIKGVRASPSSAGEPTELGICGLNGFNIGRYSSHRAAEAQFTFIGFALNDYHYSDPIGGSSEMADPDHGVGVVTGGKANTENNGPYILHAGDKFAWRLPPGPKSNYQLGSNDNTWQPGNGQYFNKRVALGNEPARTAPEMVPFDYTDFSPNMDFTYQSMKLIRADLSDQGIANIPFGKLNDREGHLEAHSLSGEQESACGHKFGKTATTLAGIEVLMLYGLIDVTPAGRAFIDAVKNKDANAITATRKIAYDAFHNSTDVQREGAAVEVDHLAEAIGLWSPEPEHQHIVLDMFANAYFNDITGTDAANFHRIFTSRMLGGKSARQVAASFNDKNDPRLNWQQLRLAQAKFTEGAIVGNYHDKLSRIGGTVITCSAPGERAHVIAK